MMYFDRLNRLFAPYLLGEKIIFNIMIIRLIY